MLFSIVDSVFLVARVPENCAIMMDIHNERALERRMEDGKKSSEDKCGALN